MKICATPPPKLPQPPAVAFAVPTTLGANMSEHQNWFVTNVAPHIPMKNRMRMKFQGALINAAAATQMAPKVNRLDCTFTGPKRSINVPKDTLTTKVEATDAIPASAKVDLHFVPPVHTHLPNTLGSYISNSAGVALAGFGFGLQSVMLSPVFS